MHPQPVRLGLLAARRGFFSERLAAEMRRDMIATMARVGIDVVVADEQQTRLGCVENPTEAQLCGDLFRARDVRGIVINAVNFGDEQAAAAAVRYARLDVPVLLMGCQEQGPLRPDSDRRDSFCGLLSIAEAMRQTGVRYSIGSVPINMPADPACERDLRWFAGVCRVVHGLRWARYGQVGARPEAFWTCRYDEKMLQRLGPTSVVLDLSEAIGAMTALTDGDPDVKATLASIHAGADTAALTDLALLKVAKLEVFLKRFAREQRLDALAVQCWTSIQKHWGACACTALSRLCDAGLSAACEADVLGAMSMHACHLAGGGAAALADWNNLHHADPELVNLWHCGVLPASFSGGRVKLGTHRILADSGAVPAELAQGVAESVAVASPVTLVRITQDGGRWKSLVVQGDIEPDAASTFGAYGWCRINRLDRLYRDVLLRHFPHHVALTQTHVADVLREALGNYLGMDVFDA